MHDWCNASGVSHKIHGVFNLCFLDPPLQLSRQAFEYVAIFYTMTLVSPFIRLIALMPSKSVAYLLCVYNLSARSDLLLSKI